MIEDVLDIQDRECARYERLNSILMTKMQNRKESVGCEEGKLYGMLEKRQYNMYESALCKSSIFGIVISDLI